MNIAKKMLLTSLLCTFTLGFMSTNVSAMSPAIKDAVQTASSMASSSSFFSSKSARHLAVLIIASPIILIYIQDLLPKEITESALFKKVIGTLEKDPEFKISSIDQDVYKGTLTEKKAATGLVGCFHAKFIKPLKKITDDCKLMRDALTLVALIFGLNSFSELLLLKDAAK